MLKNKMVAIILAGGRGSRLFDLTKRLAKPAVSFGGKYRIIDFALSNCAHSDIAKVGIAVQYESIELASYVVQDYLWGLNRRGGGVFVLPPREKEGSGFDIYEGTANAISQNIDFLDQENPAYVLVLSGDHIYKMDYHLMLNKHIESGAEATLAVIKVPLKEAGRFGILSLNEDDQVIAFEEKPKEPKSDLASMGIYIFSYPTLRKMLLADEQNSKSTHDFGKDILPTYLKQHKKVVAYHFEGYWKDVGTIQSLWQANMDLLDKSEALNLFDDDWKIYTEDTLTPPQLISSSALIDNAYITQGCQIDGYIKHSVLFTSTKVKKNAQVLNSVLMNNVEVGEGAIIENCLVMDNVKIPANAILKGESSKKILLVSTQTLKEKKV